MKSTNKPDSFCFGPGETLESLANKLRSRKFDPEELLKIKNDVSKRKILKLKKYEAIILIQRIIRGFIIRKRIKNTIYENNKKIVIEYFIDLRKRKVRENYKEIISRNLNIYLKPFLFSKHSYMILIKKINFN